MTHLNEDTLILHHYGESIAPELRSHLEHCVDCQAALERLKTELKLVSSLPDPVIPKDYGQKVWQELAPKLDQPTVANPHFRWGWLALAAAAVIGAFFLGRLKPNQPWSIDQHHGPDRILHSQLAQHLDRTTQILDKVDSPQSEPLETDELRWLLRDNRLYRQVLTQQQSPNMLEILEDIEFLLLRLKHPDPATTLPDTLNQDVEILLPKLRDLKQDLNLPTPTRQTQTPEI